MSSLFEDPSLWRLRSNNGTVPFKILGMSGDFECESGTVDLRGLIPANKIVTFLQETFPPPIRVGDMFVPQSNSLPGLPGLVAKKVSFKNQDDGKPIDPFGFDPNAISGTYHPVVEVTVNYGLSRLQQPGNDASDPRTFLEVSCQGKSELIHSTAPNASWQKQTEDSKTKTAQKEDQSNPGGRVPQSTSDSALPPVPANDPKKPDTKDTSKDPVKNPTFSTNIISPRAEWSVKWNQIPYDYFNNVVVQRLRWGEGKVNSTNFLPIFNAEPETILFESYSYTEVYTWREGLINTPPINLEMKFLEKRILWNGVICGHNHFWCPGKGWMYLLLDGKTLVDAQNEYKAAKKVWEDGGKKGNPPSWVAGGPTYLSRDLNAIFQV